MNSSLRMRAGVSNFGIDDLAELLAMARIKPALVQRHSDPLAADAEVQAFCRLAGIQYQACPPAAPLPPAIASAIDVLLPQNDVPFSAASCFKRMVRRLCRQGLRWFSPDCQLSFLKRKG